MCEERDGSGGNSPRVEETQLQSFALRTAYVSLKMWMKSINRPHSRDRNREVSPVPPTLKYSFRLPLLQRNILLEEPGGVIFWG